MGGPWEDFTPSSSSSPWEDFKPASSTSEWRGDTSGRSVKDMQREFILSQGGFKDRAKQYVQDAVPYIRPTVEGLGAAGGALVGIAGGAAAGLGVGSIPGGVAGGVIGSGLGYAGAKGLMDTVEGNWVSSPQQAATRAISDIGTGAMFEMGGQSAGKLITNAIEAAPGAYRAIRNPIQAVAENRALRTIETNAGLTETEAANLAKSQQIADRLGIKLTPGQMTGKPTQTVMEGNLAMNDPAFKATLDAQDSAARQTAFDRIQRNIGQVKPLPIAQDLQATGTSINSAIDAAEQPVRAAEAQAWGRVPQYEIPTNATEATFKDILAIPSTARDSVLKMQSLFADMPKTTAGLQTMEREINSAMQAGTQTEKRALGQLKAAINEDFNAMGTAADAGDIGLHNGKIVYPSQIQTEIANYEKQIAGAQSTPATISEQNKSLFEYLASKGEIVSQNTGISDTQYAKSLSDRLAYLQRKGMRNDYVPPTGGNGNQALIDNYTQGITAKREILDNMQPADNVAQPYGAAKSASLQRFEQFDRGATKKVLANGNEYDGSRITAENTARQFYTPTGADDLVRAIGPDQAKQQMKPFVLADMAKAAATNGENFSIQSGLTYINQNKAQLEKLGLVDEAKQLLKSQFPAEMNNILAKTAPDSTGKQLFTPQQMRTALAKYGRTIKTLYGEETLQSFRDYTDLMGMIDRKNLISRSGNSNTADKAVNMANSMIKSAEGPAAQLTDNLIQATLGYATAGGGAGLLSGHGIGTAAIGAGLGAGKQLFTNANKQAAQSFVKIMQDSVTNPETAKSLMDLRRTGKVPIYLQSIIDSHAPTGAAAGLLSGGY